MNAFSVRPRGDKIVSPLLLKDKKNVEIFFFSRFLKNPQSYHGHFLCKVVYYFTVGYIIGMSCLCSKMY